MNAYKYDSQTGEFLHEVLCQESPREPGKFLIPANATMVAPPEEQAGKARVWNGEEWGYRDDNRGKTMYSVTDSRHTSTMSNVLGANVPEGWTLTPPPDSENKYTFSGGQWVEQSVEELRAQLEDTLWSNYKTYQRTYVDPEDLTLANTCAAGGSEKGDILRFRLGGKYTAQGLELLLDRMEREEYAAVSVSDLLHGDSR